MKKILIFSVALVASINILVAPALPMKGNISKNNLIPIGIIAPDKTYHVFFLTQPEANKYISFGVREKHGKVPFVSIKDWRHFATIATKSATLLSQSLNDLESRVDALEKEVAYIKKNCCK